MSERDKSDSLESYRNDPLLGQTHRAVGLTEQVRAHRFRGEPLKHNTGPLH